MFQVGRLIICYFTHELVKNQLSPGACSSINLMDPLLDELDPNEFTFYLVLTLFE